MKNRIIVVGSTNMDMVVKTDHIPKPGETVLGGTFFMNPGGKGANQAVAAARLGGEVSFISKIGQDIFGRQSSKIFNDEGIDVAGLYTDENNPSGIALITVDDKGENSIVVAPGANACLHEADVNQALSKFEDGKILLVQLEIEIASVQMAIQQAKAKGITVILNPAPVNKSIIPLLSMVDMITPNIHEAETLSNHRITDLNSAFEAAKKIRALGVDVVIITMGEEGALICQADSFEHVTAPKVTAIDTTAAGDVFNGALAVALAEEKELIQAVNFACRAAAMAVTKMGAQNSIPYRNEITLTYLNENNQL
ncbi:ribokinase [Sphingobacterium sp. HJSM2_6]|uniref:ribokinase n=1 Tax=Sphingobacterium sp. HJSM2_6 TaxID=3366264 RepID=UPI003BD95CCF